MLIKRIVIILLLLLMTFGTGTLAYADDKEYSINSVTFIVKLDENGNALIEERWGLSFTKGSFSSFYVSRAENINELQDYDNISFKSFKINNDECTERDISDNMTPNTYLIEKMDDLTKYTWFTDMAHNNSCFETTYVLENVVKYNDDGDAFFCFAFIGKKFKKNIKVVNIEIELPSSGDIQV